MGTRDIEKLLTDLKNLPKQKAPEDLEEKLLQRIQNFERSLASGERPFKRWFSEYFNPIYVPAFTIVIVAFSIIFTITQNDDDFKNEITTIEKAIPVVQEQVTQVNEPQKISVPKKKEFVVKRDKPRLNLGPGVSLDEKEYSYSPNDNKQPSLVDFPYPNEPITIRIPPPELIFKEELERMGIQVGNRDSIRLINNRRR